MRIYRSKNDIYKDFPIALKFSLEHLVKRSDYEDLLKEFARRDRAKLTRFADWVANFGSEFPMSVGFFVEMDVVGDTGQTIGTQMVLLEHETGWEFFIPLASGFAGRLGSKIAGKVTDEALDAALGRLITFLKNEWSSLIYGGTRIDHVEIRTEVKGVMRIPFSQFDLSQLKCLVENFHFISNLSECNSTCFQGMLVEVSRPFLAPNEVPRVPQAVD